MVGDVQMRHRIESQGLLEQLSIELQELARVCRASIRDDKADIEILRMLGDSPRRSRNGRDVSLKAIHFLLLKLVTPHFYSLTSHPIFKPLRFHRHQFRITTASSQYRYSFHRR